MILSGTMIGFICVLALLGASVLIAVLDRKEKKKGKFALILFLGAFLGGVVMTLLAGIRAREEGGGMTGRPPMRGGMQTIGEVDQEEFNRLVEKVSKDPKDLRSRERLGHLYLQMQDFENVFRMAHEALQLDPKSVESRVHMAMVLFTMGEIDQSLAQFDRALELDPKNLEALRFKGMVEAAAIRKK